MRTADAMHMRHTRRPAGRCLARPKRGFTLIEIVVSTVILTIVLTSLYASFRTGTKAYDIGQTHSEGSQMARFAMNQIVEDLHNIFYRTPNSYNITRRQREAVRADKEKQMLAAGKTLTEVEELALPELGPMIDLSFKAGGGSGGGDLTFVRSQGQKHGEDKFPWGLVRVRYYVANNVLYRSLDDIKAPETDEDGNEIPKATVPQVDKIGNYVKAFDLKFGYWTEGEWRETTDWDSSPRQYRNPISDEELEQNEMLALTGGQANPQLQLNDELIDNLPAWVEVSVTFTDPRKEEREKTYKQIVQMPQSQENYIPPDMMGDSKTRGPFDGPRRRGKE